jgi:phosphohistidine phosphatase SixA
MIERGTEMKPKTKASALLVPFAAAALLGSAAAFAATLSDDRLAEELRKGGYVIVMRHASAEREAPERPSPANANRERQLDEHGRNTMTAMRSAFRRLEVRVGEVWSSPAFRARETAEHLGFGFRRLQIAEELGGESGDAAWLRARAAQPPAEGHNSVIITHARNLSQAFGEEASGMRDGEALIYRPGEGEATLVARLEIEEWASLGR